MMIEGHGVDHSMLDQRFQMLESKVLEAGIKDSRR